MSLALNKEFVRGLFTLEESNRSLFLTPIAYFTVAAILSLGFTLIPFPKNAELMLSTMTMFIGAVIALFIASTINIYFYKHLLKFDPFKNDGKEESKVAAIFEIPVMNALICLCLLPIVLGNLGNGQEIMFIDRLRYLTCSVVVFAIAQSFLKLHILEQIDRIKNKKQQQEKSVEII